MISDNTRWSDEDDDHYWIEEYVTYPDEIEEWETWVTTSPIITVTTAGIYDQDADQALPDGEAKNGSLIIALALSKVRDDLDDKLTPAQRVTLEEAIRRLDPEGNVRSVLKEIEDGWEES